MTEARREPTGEPIASLEECRDLKLDFSKLERMSGTRFGVLPVAVQNIDTGEVILLAYTNEAAFRECMQKRSLVLWSTSRNELWEKGMTSGNTFEVVEVMVNCDQNSLVYKVRPGRCGICHTKNRKGMARNCFYRRVNMESLRLENLDP